MAGRVLAVLAVAIAAAVVGGSTAAQGTGGAANAGGTYRVAYESSFNFTDGFDPTGEY